MNSSNTCLEQIARGENHFRFAALNIHVDQVDKSDFVKHGRKGNRRYVADKCIGIIGMTPVLAIVDIEGGLSVPFARVTNRKGDGPILCHNRSFDQAMPIGIEPVVSEVLLHPQKMLGFRFHADQLYREIRVC